MSDESTEAEEAPKKSPTRRAILLGVPIMLVAGGGGFFAAYSGLLPFGGGSDAEDEDTASDSSSSRRDVEFIALDPMIVSIGRANQNRHLRFQAQLEVDPGNVDSVESVLPRVVDVLNGYLRAVDMALLDDPSALTRLRAQMLRRIQIVSGDNKIRDLLIMEFVLS